MSGTDRDRELHPHGHREAKFLALVLATLDTPPDRLVVSPFVRAQQTATIIDRTLGLGLITDDRLRCGQAPSAVLQLVEAHADAGSLVIVGHNPTLDDLIGVITGGPVAYGPGLRTGEAFVIDCDPSNPIGNGIILAQVRHQLEDVATS